MATLSTQGEHEQVSMPPINDAIETGWRAPVLVLSPCRGFWIPTRFLQAALAAQNHFQSRPTDLFLVSSPKSGTVWLKSLIFSIVNRTQHPLLSPQHPLLTTNPHNLVPFLDNDLYADNLNPDLSTITSPRLFATHVPYLLLPESVKDSRGCRIVYICRNPKDTFVSFWHFARKLAPIGERSPLPLEEAFELFCKGASPYGPYWEHALGYWKESLEMPHKVLFLKYDEVKSETKHYLKKLAGFLGYPFSGEEEENGMVEDIVKMCSIENLKSVEINKSGVTLGIQNEVFFRRGVIGDWKNYLTDAMIERMEQITQKNWHGTGLTFQV